ncbi:hypothetical protein BD410DRAFT_856826 [Rickenella mellea]|uniref:Uncharacterized protein n=1 Tax=Rickenella mellea TaxID=50990 RepID=A0A4Y7Q7Z6_9AGAM|nr:hypothetical protein BD410DRAFT_856826 [Rickenella mellea]
MLPSKLMKDRTPAPTRNGAQHDTFDSRNSHDHEILRRAPHDDSSNKLNNTDAHFIESNSLTAILPVDMATHLNLSDALHSLLVEETMVDLIMIICPPHVCAILHSTLSSRHGGILSEISLFPWLHGVSPGFAMIEATSHVTTDWTLFLGNEGLHGLDLHVQDQLINPVFTGLPAGPCGAIAHAQSISCLQSVGTHAPAHFLVPPFVAPTRLFQNLTVNSTSEINSWATLGREVSNGSSDRVGGFVLGTSPQMNDWCNHICHERSVGLDPSAVTRFHPDGTAPSRILPDPSLQRNATTSNLGRLLVSIILSSKENLKSFSPAICKMIDNKHDVRVLLLNTTAVEDDGKMCDVPYTEFRSTIKRSHLADDAIFWLTAFLHDSEIRIYSSSTKLSSFHSRSPGIEIPDAELLYADWIGSLTGEELRNWHKPRIEISVITNDRPTSLHRLLASLQSSRFFGDSVDVRINMEQTADKNTQQLVKDFRWDHGRVFVHHRVIHAGLFQAVVESWYPQTDDSYGLILEDDVELSPLFYAWVKLTLLRFRYGSKENLSPSLFGISLYQQKNTELRPEGRKPFNAQAVFDAHGLPYSNTPYLSQVPCSWGAVYFPEHWREFHSYLAIRLSQSVLPIDEPIVLNVRSNNWTKSWKKYFIELVYLRGYVMLYPNYPNFVSFSTNHLEVGSHVKDSPRHIYNEKLYLFDLPLMVLPNDTQNDEGIVKLLDLPQKSMPSWSELPVMDLVGLVSSEDALSARGRRRRDELMGCDVIAGTGSFDPRELFMCDGG